ncbi:MAG: T9SS type A sorting domain-containing protein [Bacteroidota bacterium]
MRKFYMLVLLLGLVSFKSFGQSCPTPFVLDWDTQAFGTDPRNNTFSAADVDVSIQSIDIYGHVSFFAVSNQLQATNSIVWEQNIDNDNEFAVATFKFSRPTKDFTFSIFDVDLGTFIDSLTINGYSDGRLVSLAASDVATSVANTFIGANTVVGTANVGDASADGNVTFAIPESIDSLVVLYNNNTAPSNQIIGIHDFAWCGADSDYDQVLNIDDADDDNDGVPDIVEGGGVDPGADEDGDDIPDYLDPTYSGFVDANGDGISDNFDTDLDGVPNHLDRDLDNDGIPDAVEANGGVLPANMSSDGRYTIAYAQANDTDGDGIVNDLDVDNGGTPFANPDTDGDLITDLFDRDSDGDGIPDLLEVGGVEADGNGQVDNFEDIDNDGLADIYDITLDGNALVIRDTENDNVPDYRDIDADADGILDNVEAQSSAAFRAATGTDTDGDGIDDAYDSDVTGAIVFQDTDGDGLEDFIDGDSDGDGIRDFIEGHDPDMDGIQETFATNNDADGDGLDNAFDIDNGGTSAVLQNSDTDNLPDWRDLDDDNDGIPTVDEDFNSDNVYNNDFTQGGGATPDYLFNINDPDGDGFDNDADLDDNNDGIPDTEQGLGIDPGADLDTDGTPNYLDTDFVHPTLGAFADANADGINDLFDADMDGIPNHFDLDSDNDGIPNAVEANAGALPANMNENGQYPIAYAAANDANNDGLVNDVDTGSGGTVLSTDTDGDGIDDFLDADSDADGIPDAIEAGGTDANNNGFVDTFRNTDGDALPDYLDFDSDGDGISDIVEAQSTAGFTSPSGTDTDGDGIDDAFDSDNGGTNIDPVDTDVDGTPDYRDTDSDNDTVLDEVEGHDANEDGTADRTAIGTDTDGDGLDNAFDPDNGGTTAPIQNTDIIDDVDYRDADDDGDGIPTKDESTDLSPANGVADYLEVTVETCGNELASISGNAVAVALVNGVTNGANALGAPNSGGTTANTATFDAAGEFLVLDLQEFLPGGSVVTISLFINTNTQITISSTNLTTLFGAASVPYFGPNTFGTIGYTVPAQGTRYIFIRVDAGTFFIDALAYSICIADTDNDGIADRSDLDDDNDGITDLAEISAYAFDPSADDDLDGLLNYLDTNISGFVDTNFDGVDDRADSDLDGIPNHLDLDADNDGIVDITEANGGTLPANASSEGRYVASYALANDANNDGLVNDVDGSPLSNPDTDGDGIADVFDLDSDNDGITDLAEAGGTDIDGNGQVDDFLDSDGDGLANMVDPDNGGTVLAIPNSDGNGNPDYLDADSDDDGINDIVEGHDNNNDGRAEWDTNNNRILDASEGDADADGDGILDAFDRDEEGRIAFLPDADNDGLFNYRDSDDDGDGISTFIEDTNGNGIWSDDFTEGQTGPNAGIPDYLFNEFTVLPVELISFTGNWRNGNVDLTWETASEVNNDRFEIEYSTDAKSFAKVGEVKGNGDSEVRLTYNFTHRTPQSGVNFYRLKQIDFDGTSSFSNVVRVEAPLSDEALEATVFPNPWQGGNELRVRLTSFSTDHSVSVSIVSMRGEVLINVVEVSVDGSGIISFSTDQLLLEQGVYLVQVEQAGERVMKRLIVGR